MRLRDLAVFVIWLGLAVSLPFLIAKQMDEVRSLRWPPQVQDISPWFVLILYAALGIWLVVAFVRGK